ncbi:MULTISPECIES: hypothetical protein [Kamptonema]|uniref:hypothetical protein n=1 Tax=Kamptonema TaxID=1501433 RepID=UPI0001DACC58|nr:MULTISPECIES: hypothetical protein [Kamptonema]CBN56345.1 conserved hypothetical protein [Kamptonema sp. PCC 6506]
MHILTEDEFNLEAEPFLRKIFVHDNPFKEPFSSQVIGRTIIYPCEDENDSLLIEALISAAVKLGDTGCYISLISTGYPEHGPGHCYIPLSEFLEGYSGTEKDRLIGPRLGINPYTLDSVIYSAQGKWGLMKSHERFGLLGGSPEFIEEIRGAVPDLDKQVYGFFKRLRDLLLACSLNPPDITRNKWLPTLLTHVYGSEIAEKLLEEETRLIERM